MRTVILALFTVGLITACDNPNSAQLPHPGIGECQYQSGDADAGKKFVHCVLTDTYLWADDVEKSVDYSAYASEQELLTALKGSNDRFSGIQTKQSSDDYFITGKASGDSGMRLYFNDNTNPSYFWVYRVYKNSPAHALGIRRGNQITHINGVSIAQMAANVQAGSNWGEQTYLDPALIHSFTWIDNAQTEQSGSTAIVDYAIDTVDHVQLMQTGDGQQGFYLAFNGFIQPSIAHLADAMGDFALQSFDFAIIDLRNNGGGYTYVANMLASALGGFTVRQFSLFDETLAFKRDIFNSKYAQYNSFEAFYRNSQMPSALKNSDFGLKKVIFLTNGGSCSSSELLINSLRPFTEHLEVVVIGTPSCGKPYGMYSKEFGNQVLFAIEVKSANATGFAEYQDGMPIHCAASAFGLNYDWGDQNDPLIANALHHVAYNQCLPEAANRKAVSNYDEVIDLHGRSLLDPHFGRL